MRAVGGKLSVSLCFCLSAGSTAQRGDYASPRLHKRIMGKKRNYIYIYFGIRWKGLAMSSHVDCDVATPTLRLHANVHIHVICKSLNTHKPCVIIFSLERKVAVY